MAEKDYYNILGVEKTATDAEIKKAYHKLALKYHPDRNKDNKDAETRFKEISEAYAVLRDKEKRQQYDTYGSADFQQRYSQEDIFRNFDLGDILKEFGFGGGGVRFKQSFGGGGGGGGGFSGGMGGRNPFGHGMGGGFGNAGHHQMSGSDLEYEVPLSLDELFSGTRKTLTLNQGDQSETLTVKIPKGMVPGKKIRVPGKGQASPYGGPRGNLMIKSRLLPHPEFQVEGNNVTIYKEVKLSDALLGTRVEITPPNGKAVTITVPPGTRHKSKMRLAGRGIPRMNQSGSGDLFVLIGVAMPKKLTAEQKKLIEKLAKTGL